MTPNEVLNQAKAYLDNALSKEKTVQKVIESIGPAIVESLKPVIEESLRNIQVNVNPEITLPEMKSPDVYVDAPIVNVPEAQVTVNVPPVKVPKSDVKVNILTKALTNEMRAVRDAIKTQPIPMYEKPIEYSKKQPIPALIVDVRGKPMDFGGGGQVNSVLRFIDAQSVPIPVSATNPLPITGSFSTTPYGTYFASDAVASVNVIQSISFEQKQVSGFADSVYVLGAAASTYAELLNPDGRVKVELPTGSSGLTDTELRASSLEVRQVSGFTDSVNVVGFTSTVGTYNLNGDGSYRDTFPVSGVFYQATQPISSSQSFETKQVSGFTDSVNVIGFTSTVGTSLLNADGTYRDTMPVSGTFFQTTQPVSAVQSFETKQVSGFANSVFVMGSADSMLSYQARTTNPTAVSDGSDVRPSTDKLGRTLTRPVQVRDLMSTAYITLSTGTEATLLASGGAGVYNDLIYIMGANTSGAAVQVDIRDLTAGGVVMSLSIPANGTAGVSLPVPFPQGNANNNWTADMPDITNSNVLISALFSKEV